MVTWILVTSGITKDAGPPTRVVDRTAERRSAQRVVLLGPDDEARRALHLMLDRTGKQVAAMADLDGARRYLAANDVDAVIATAELAPRVREGTTLSAPVIAVARTRDLDAAIALFDAGVDDVVCEPLDELALAIALRHVGDVPRRGLPSVSTPSLVGDGEAMQRLRATIDQIARTKSTVLILGESGTGKELVARAMHDASPRRHRRFVAINCAAIPGAAARERAVRSRARRVHGCGRATSRACSRTRTAARCSSTRSASCRCALQAKLLRALQEGEIRRVGDSDVDQDRRPADRRDAARSRRRM